MKKDNPEKLKEYRNKKQQRYREKKKAEKRHKEALEIDRQFKAGNLNYGIKLEAPKGLSWQEWKKENPQGDFWDFLDYRRTLRTPEVEKLEMQSQEDMDYKRMKAEKIAHKIEGTLKSDIQLGVNIWHPEAERTDLDIAIEKENRMKAIIAKFYQKFKL